MSLYDWTLCSRHDDGTCGHACGANLFAVDVCRKSVGTSENFPVEKFQRITCKEVGMAGKRSVDRKLYELYMKHILKPPLD